MAIVLGGTFGVMFVTTPKGDLLCSARRLRGLFSSPAAGRHTLIEEIVRIARQTRQRGMIGLEPLAMKASDPLLREGLLLAIDLGDRKELTAALETELRLKERHGSADAKVFEVAAGFAPTIGILGTVVGLIQVLHRFTDLDAVATGIGTCFVSTIYGLGLANLVLLPLAQRIHARVAAQFEAEELIVEGILCIMDIRNRLLCFLNEAPRSAPDQIDELAVTSPLVD
jgi:chemotaxis protein MotA